MSEEAVNANVAAEVPPVETMHTVETQTNQASDAGVEDSVSVCISVNVGGDAITPSDEKVPHSEKVVVVASPSETVLPEKDDVSEKDENSEPNKTSSNEAVAKSLASDVQSGDSVVSVSNDAATKNTLLNEILTNVETNKAVVISPVSEIVIIQKGVDSSSEDENEDKKTDSICSEKAQTGSVDNGSRPDTKENSLTEEHSAYGSETASKSQQTNGRRKGYRNRTKSGGQNDAGSRSDTENAVEPGAQQNGSGVRRNSYRRPFRGGRGRGRRRGRGRGGFSDGGLSSPPFRQNFGEPCNYGFHVDGRYRQSDYDYRASNGNRDRPGYYAARIVSRGAQHNKPKSKNDESTAPSQGNASESGATESVANNSQSNEGNKRGRRRGNYRNRTRSSRFADEVYQNDEVLGAAGGVPVEPKGRQNYYRYSYRAPNYNPRNDYHGHLHGFYHGYYYDGGYHRPYYGFGNGYGYGRGSSRWYNNGGGRRGGFRPRSKSNTNQSESTVKNEASAALNGNTVAANGTTDPLATECSS